MNQFLTSRRHEFKGFIDAICAVSPNLPTPPSSPSYSAPLQIYTRLPPLAREGYPSLPHLIDYTHSFASLVKVWLDNNAFAPATNGADGGPEFLIRFHNECLRIRQLGQDLFRQADRIETNNVSDPTQSWIALARRLDTEPDEFWKVEASSSASSRVNVGGTSLHQVPEAVNEPVAIQFAPADANGSARRRFYRNGNNSRPSTSPGRAAEEQSSRSPGIFRFRSRSRSRPGSSRMKVEERDGQGPDAVDEGSDSEEDAVVGEQPRRGSLAKAIGRTKDKDRSGRKSLFRRKTDK